MVAALQHSGEKDTDRTRFMLDWLSREVAKLRLQIKPGQQRCRSAVRRISQRPGCHAGGFRREYTSR
jgi:hypothetical protein